MDKYILSAYKPSSTNFWHGNVIEEYPSDYSFEYSLSEELLITKMIEYLYNNAFLRTNEAGYELNICPMQPMADDNYAEYDNWDVLRQKIFKCATVAAGSLIDKETEKRQAREDKLKIEQELYTLKSIEEQYERLKKELGK